MRLVIIMEMYVRPWRDLSRLNFEQSNIKRSVLPDSLTTLELANWKKKKKLNRAMADVTFTLILIMILKKNSLSSVKQKGRFLIWRILLNKTDRWKFPKNTSLLQFENNIPKNITFVWRHKNIKRRYCQIDWWQRKQSS